GPATGGPEALAPTVDGARPALHDVAAWWATHADVDVVPLAVSGPGFLDALAQVGTEVLAGVVPGPDGADLPVAVRRRTADDGSRTVYVDASQVPATRGRGEREPANRGSAAGGAQDDSLEV